MTTFVLVPGAWLGAWAWEEVAARLTAAGHRAVPVTLPGLAERAGEEPVDGIGPESHVDAVVSVITREDLHGAVLVAHSAAAALAGPVAGRVPGRLARVVLVGAGPVPDGTCLADLLGPDAGQVLQAMAEEAGTPGLVPPPADEILGQYYPAHGMDADVLARFRARATGHPLGVYTGKVVRTGAGDGVPVTVVWCTGDGPAPAATGGEDVVEIDAGHWPMLTTPGPLAATLTGLS
jgi:pimeloyl-ACP methyl ester carboxylesterase